MREKITSNQGVCVVDVLVVGRRDVMKNTFLASVCR